MSWRDCGPEWHPVLIVLGVLAVAVALSLWAWWAGVVFVFGLLAALSLAVWR